MRRVAEYRRQNPELNPELIDRRARVPSYLQSLPTSTEPGVDIKCLVGTTIRHLDGKTGEVVECTVYDYGTSYLRGDWVEVAYELEDDRGMHIPMEEMNDILSSRIL